MHWTHPACDIGRWWALPPLALAIITAAGLAGALTP